MRQIRLRPDCGDDCNQTARQWPTRDAL